MLGKDYGTTSADLVAVAAKDNLSKPDFKQLARAVAGIENADDDGLAKQVSEDFGQAGDESLVAAEKLKPFSVVVRPARRPTIRRLAGRGE